jgi:hypothetical protein
MTKKQIISIASFKAESWPVAIRPARLRKSAKPDRVLHLDVSLVLLSGRAAKPADARAPRIAMF